MLVKVQHAGPDGGTRQFNAEVPDPPPQLYTFQNPVNRRFIEARLVSTIALEREADDLAIYEELPQED